MILCYVYLNVNIKIPMKRDVFELLEVDVHVYQINYNVMYVLVLRYLYMGCYTHQGKKLHAKSHAS